MSLAEAMSIAAIIPPYQKKFLEMSLLDFITLLGYITQQRVNVMYSYLNETNYLSVASLYYILHLITHTWSANNCVNQKPSQYPPLPSNNDFCNT